VVFDKTACAYLFEKYIYILALETASPIVSALSFPGRTSFKKQTTGRTSEEFQSIKGFGEKLEPNTGRFE